MKIQILASYLAISALYTSPIQAASLCDTDDDCQRAPSETPDCIDGVCQKGCTADADCIASSPVCIGNVCRKSCQTSDDCVGGDLPICINNVCRECDSDGQCYNVGACVESNCAGACVDNYCKSCREDSHCTHEFWSFCSDNQCRNCVTDEQCPRNLDDAWVNGDICVQHVCRECASDADCNSPENPYCDTEGDIYQNFECRECTDDSHCAPRPCYVHHCGCLDDSECPVEHHCDTSGACECNFDCCEDFECYNPNEICLDHVCVCPDGEDCSQHQESFCFSATATVQLSNEKKKTMGDLQVGDSVLVGKVSEILLFEPVYAFAHWDSVQKMEFLQITTSPSGSGENRPLEVSPDHLVYVQGKYHPVPAASIKMGDALCGTDSCALHVVRIDTISRRDGVYAPLTPSGNIVVDGFLTSNYIGVQDHLQEYPVLSNGVTLPMAQHRLIHLWLSPFRMICMMGMAPSFCQVPADHDKPLWVNWGLQLAHYADHQSTTRQLFLLAVALTFFVPLYCLELAFMSITYSGLLVLAGFGLWAMTRGYVTTKTKPFGNSKKHV